MFQSLSDEFPGLGLDMERLLHEWDILKGSMMEEEFQELGYRGVVRRVTVDYEDLLPNLHKLAAIALVLPVSTAGKGSDIYLGFFWIKCKCFPKIENILLLSI